MTKSFQQCFYEKAKLVQEFNMKIQEDRIINEFVKLIFYPSDPRDKFVQVAVEPSGKLYRSIAKSDYFFLDLYREYLGIKRGEIFHQEERSSLEDEEQVKAWLEFLESRCQPILTGDREEIERFAKWVRARDEEYNKRVSS